MQTANSPRKILLVEDDQEMISAIQSYLVDSGFEVATATGGDEALAEVRRATPHLIISDIMMPKGSGLAFLEAIKSHPKTCLIPFIIITGKDSRPDYRRGMVLGADDYITKPFHLDELKRSVVSSLARAQRVQQAIENFGRGRLDSLPHELRTPLNGIVAISELMQEHLSQNNFDPELLRDEASIIHESGIRLQRLVENYMLYYELRMLTLSPEPSNQDWREFTCESRISLSNHLESCHRQNDLTMDLAAERLKMPPEFWRKLVNELLDNAFKFSAEGTPVRLVGKRDADGQCYLLELTDCGSGLEITNFASLTPFQPARCDSPERFGPGLGLPIVGMIAQLCDLEIDVDSKPNAYTRLVIRIPIASQTNASSRMDPGNSS